MIHVAGKFEAMQRATGVGSLIRLRDAGPRSARRLNGRKRSSSLNSGVEPPQARQSEVVRLTRFSDAKTCVVSSSGDPVTVTAEHVILTNGTSRTAVAAIRRYNSLLHRSAVAGRSRAVCGCRAGYIGLELDCLPQMGSNVRSSRRWIVSCPYVTNSLPIPFAMFGSCDVRLRREGAGAYR